MRVSRVKYIYERFANSDLTLADLLESLYVFKILQPTVTIPELYARLYLNRSTMNDYCKDRFNCTVSEWLEKRAKGPVYPDGSFVVKSYCMLTGQGQSNLSDIAGELIQLHIAISEDGRCIVLSVDGTSYLINSNNLKPGDYLECGVTCKSLLDEIKYYNYSLLA